MGIEELSKVVVSGSKCATAIVNKSGVFSIIGSLLSFSSVEWPKVSLEIKDLSEDEIKSLEALVLANFNPEDGNIKFGFADLLALGERSYAFVQKTISEGTDAFEALKGLVEDWKAFFGVK